MSETILPKRFFDQSISATLVDLGQTRHGETAEVIRFAGHKDHRENISQ
jgi:hypothetical protein